MHILEFPILTVTVGGDTPMHTLSHPGDSARSHDYRPPHRTEAAHVTELLEQALDGDGIESFFLGMAGRIAAALPHDVLVTFVIDGEGGGVWTLHTDHDRIDVQQGRAIWADSELRCSLPRFQDLVSGAVDVRQAFFDGTVQVEGDVGLLLRLYEALPHAV